MINLLADFCSLVKKLYQDQNPVPLHAPVFLGKEKEYLTECVTSTFVSYVGRYVTKFEEMTAHYTGAKYAVAVVNGTAALQIALQIAGVKSGDEVITQPLTFVATANAIAHCGASPVFIDVDQNTMGLSPEKLRFWLKNNTKYSKPAICLNKLSGKRISAIVPMHTFGHPALIAEIAEIAGDYQIPLIEDAAESLGSFYKKRHTGTFGLAGILSYNGNKTVTTGGGGMIITDDGSFAERAKHITTTAKVPHKWEYAHDRIAYNYRLPNVNAALGTAQMEYLDKILANKRETAEIYQDFFRNTEVLFFSEPDGASSNYWLNVIRLKNRKERDGFLEYTNSKQIMTRPVWKLMNQLVMYKECLTGNLDNAMWLADRVVNIPSGYR
jgi:aminotransferase in exopolysaccharide biosynthesis